MVDAGVVDCVDYIVDVGIRGNDDPPGHRNAVRDLCQELDSIHRWHAVVAEHHRDFGMGGEKIQGGFGVVCAKHRAALSQRALDEVEILALIVHGQYYSLLPDGSHVHESIATLAKLGKLSSHLADAEFAAVLQAEDGDFESALDEPDSAESSEYHAADG
jgi:hypothetical protein